jgi:hypothetical protein
MSCISGILRRLKNESDQTNANMSYCNFIVAYVKRGHAGSVSPRVSACIHARHEALVATARCAVNQPQDSKFVRLVEGRILAK